MFDILFCQSLFLAQAVQAGGNEPAAEPMISPGMIVFFILIATIVAGWFLGGFICKALNTVDYSGRMATVLIPVLLALLIIGSKWPPKFGVDLRGGINMVGSLNLEALGDNEGGPLPQAKDIIPNLVQRVNPSGTKEIMIRALGADKIEVTIPSTNLQDADNIWKRLVEAGKLEFRIVAEAQKNAAEFDLARQQAASGSRKREVKNAEGDTVAKWTSVASIVPPQNDPTRLMPLKHVPSANNLVRDKSSGRIVNFQEFSGVLTGDMDEAAANLAIWCDRNGIRTLQILMLEPPKDKAVNGVHLSSVSNGTDERGRGCVYFKTTSAGTSMMGSFTAINKNRPMGIVVDDQLHSAPNINEAIYGNGQITGQFTPEEVEELVIKLKSGKLEVALNKAPISKDFIESTLGQELKEKGIWAITVSLILVLIFMMFYYRFAGFVATAALVLNLILILALIMAINQPLTLTGLAGLVLTVGMSVDANVLIFERIREELDRGAALRMAIRNGFDKATTTIVDANVTTLITAIVLYVIGTEQIKGFSVTLILGILMSMFTAIFCSRLIFDIAERKRFLTKLSMTRLLSKNKMNFLNKVSLTGVMSAALIVAGVYSIFHFGPRLLNHDLRGGSTVRMVFNEAQDVEEIRDTLEEAGVVHNDERIDFSVTGFNNDDNPELKDRVFKVDSSLPAWEGGDEETRFEQLDELLSRLFKDKLQLHHVDVGDISTPATETDTSLNQPKLRLNIDQLQRTGAQWSAAPASIMFPTAASAFLLQDAGTTEGSGAGESPSVETETDSEPGQLDLDSVDTDSIPDDKPAAPQASPSELAEPETPGAAEQKVTTELSFNQPITGKTVRSLLVDASKEVELDLEDSQVILDSPDVQPDESADSTLSKNWSVTMEVQRKADAGQIINQWADTFNTKPYFPTTSKVGGQIARKTQLQALGAIAASLIGIIAYIWIRFQNIAFGLAAVIALIHDVLIVLGAIAISHWLAGALGFLKIDEFKISLEIVAALLTVIGYSLNDTIVVFDRIREVRGKRTEITADMINDSISQTLSRTILTSLTTFIVVFILYWFGGDAIHGFAFALVIGVIVGTYSSIFVASPALLWLMNSVGLNPGVVDPAAE
jgi:SecD/SecF fusion protein